MTHSKQAVCQGLRLAALTLAICVELLSLPAQAQIQVSVKLDKVQHIVQEPLSATVSMTNRSGADFILAGPKGGNWLLCELTDEAGHLLSAHHTEEGRPIAFAAGETLTRTLKVAPVHMLEQGTYALKGSIYHGPSGQFYESNRAVLQVQEGMPFGQKLVYGVPPQYADAGRTRSYRLLTHQDYNHTYLYLRIVDEETKCFLSTFQLGTLTMFRDPQFTLDRANNLHIMFLTAPNFARYCVVQPDGVLASQQTLRESETDRAKLFLTGANEVVVRGGSVYDPKAERSAAAKAKKTKGVSEKPPGL